MVRKKSDAGQTYVRSSKGLLNHSRSIYVRARNRLLNILWVTQYTVILKGGGRRSKMNYSAAISQSVGLANSAQSQWCNEMPLTIRVSPEPALRGPLGRSAFKDHVVGRFLHTSLEIEGLLIHACGFSKKSDFREPYTRVSAGHIAGFHANWTRQRELLVRSSLDQVSNAQ